MRNLLRTLFVIAALIVPVMAFGNATITIVNFDGPGEGFNDPTPRAPLGGNPGTTLGEQRLRAFEEAARLWGQTLDSKVEIKIEAVFDPLTCTSTGATLGSANVIQIFGNFPNAPVQNTWYHVALANKLAGEDLAPGPVGTIADDIVARFNSALNGNPACLGGTQWYLGFDNNHGTDIDLITVLLHEFGHGLGFSSFASRPSGAFPLGLPGIYDRNLLDTTNGLTFDQETQAQRAASMIKPRKIVWTGGQVTAAASQVLQLGVPLFRVNSPSSISGNYEVGPAIFGPAISSSGITGNVVVALDAADGAGPSTTDACSAITNASAVAGHVALVDRGTCGFIVKVKNAQIAGAIAVLVADNAPGGPPAGLGGADPTITIPSARITLDDGNAIKTALAGGTVNGTLSLDMTVRAGTNAAGFVFVNTPNPIVAGSSVSHWDPIAFKNLLMEPAINGDLTHNLVAPDDLTLEEMRDIGWYPDADLDLVSDEVDQCLGSDLQANIVIAGCDTAVPSPLSPNGCTRNDSIAKIAASARNHGEFVSGVSALSNEWKNSGQITGAQKGAIQSCAAGAAIP